MNELTLPEKLQTKIAPLHQQALDLTVDSQETCEVAVNFAGYAAGAVKELDEFFDPNIALAHKLHKSMVAQKKSVVEPVEQAKNIAKGKALAWQQAEEDKRLAEQRRLQAAADEEARKKREAMEAMAARCKKPETIAKWEEAAANVAPAPVVIIPPPPKIAGAVARETWKAQITDPAALWNWIFDNRRSDLVQLNGKELDRLAKAQQGQAQVPGVRFYVERDLAVRSA
jgi:hypothetical protein